jgi:mono/diheme cytochrome c family protein
MKIGWGHLVFASWVVVASTAVSTAPSGHRPTARRAQLSSASEVPIATVEPRANPALPSKAFVDTYCATCHNQRLKTAGLVFDALDVTNVAADAPAWEKVIVKLRAGLMPPAGMPRPKRSIIDDFTSSVEAAIDRAAEAHPNPGRTESFHRLNRAEYQNAIRDLLALDIDGRTLLPHDEVSYGFDNIAGVLKLSPLLTERYLGAARKVARLALGTPGPPNGALYRVPDQLDQDVRLEGMPVGTRGGTRVDYFAPRDGEYDIKARIGRGIDSDIPHFLGEQHLEISVDGERIQLFILPATPEEDLNIEREVFKAPEAAAPRRGDQPKVDADGNPLESEIAAMMARRRLDDNWVLRVPLHAGRHEIRATFIMKTDAVPEGFRRPFLKPYIGRGIDDARETREGASLRELEIMGPLNPGGAEESPSHRRVFVCHPAKAAEEAGCAKTILSTLARRAYRRPVTDEDVKVLLDFYNQGRAGGDFEAGIELAVQRTLVSPSFLFRTEFPPGAAATPGSRAYRISDVELASRLSFFLWSSIPDDQLLDLAAQGKLHEPAVLERQTRRMLADPRSQAFTTNFAGQWLSLRRLADIVPDPFLFPDYGDTLALAFQREAELFFDSVVREDRSTVDLLMANYTFVNERLAQHYGIPNVKGVNFRRVALADDSPRRGLLGKGAVLTVTALPNRTSPVVRGKWVLQNLFGTPPPEPPPNIPALEENGNQITKVRTMRARLEQHRANPACASCHKMMDPIGFALESFDAVGKYRAYDENFESIDTTGAYADGTRIDGLAGLRQVLVNHSGQFLVNMTNMLLTYALGRGVEYYDAPAVRSIVRDAAPQNYRLSSLILGVVKSAPFQMRRSES